MQPFSNLSEHLTVFGPVKNSWWYLKRFISCRGRNTSVIVLTNTPTNGQYWTQYHLCYGIAVWVINGLTFGRHMQWCSQSWWVIDSRLPSFVQCFCAIGWHVMTICIAVSCVQFLSEHLEKMLYKFFQSSDGKVQYRVSPSRGKS